ncbi:MAG: NAD(P)-dependent glycerol-3-phosphate dehydrogenase [Nanoarchaeota archaeon]|nr:NAD(P)-dependent glycerol-3-phosphate dehydrogenase [Nanoarchaeota archaeon]MBU1644522.1 NAD(P)-dependent glycerol-3-phosphate dehydrogenase [Nanoarchaeota archaeon]MBU1976415.1 NAD(P)-dependent glycerol-3-phosphate dehydrogenase [Nanoarchaeota archaeon]
MNIAILGGGSWGTALAVHLAGKDHSVKVWEFFEEQARKMQDERICPLLAEVNLSENILISSNIAEVVPGTDLVFLVVPSDKVEVTIESARGLITTQPVIICSKGFGKGLRFLDEVVKEKIFGNVYCLYGPTHAEEVGQGKFSGIVLAGKNSQEREKIKEVLSSDFFKVELSDDLKGVQVSSALKNVIAVFMGVLDGKGMGDNAKAYVITKGVEEIKKVGLALGAREETFYGLAGLGDVFVTATSKHSRNRHVGEQVGKGRKIDEVIAEMKMVAEGVTTVKEAIGLKEKLNLELPLIEGLYQIIFEGKEIEKILSQL